MARLLDRDLLAGVGALAWAVAALFVVELRTLCSTEAAGGFALVALGFWWRKGRAPAEEAVTAPRPKVVIDAPRVRLAQPPSRYPHDAPTLGTEDAADTHVDGEPPMGVA